MKKNKKSSIVLLEDKAWTESRDGGRGWEQFREECCNISLVVVYADTLLL